MDPNTASMPAVNPVPSVRLDDQLGLSKSPVPSLRTPEPEASMNPVPSIHDLNLGPSATVGVQNIWSLESGLSKKIRMACQAAKRDGYRYMWIDSSCIDKTSSSELSEAINSMFHWYNGAHLCYVFLSDVSSNEDVRAKGSKFRKSRWFTRVWTLQELIAPRDVVFFSLEWEVLGTKDTLADLIEDITHIDRGILTQEKGLDDESVAERMRWASKREATRVEDKAYSLLGIFGITMPTLYGEGRHAFQRLQEEILRRIPDQSLFAWGSTCVPVPDRSISTAWVWKGDSDDSPFATSPRSFNLSQGNIVAASGPWFESLGLPVNEYTLTSYGVRTQLCLLPLKVLDPNFFIYGLDGVGAWYLAILGCQCAQDQQRLLSRLCYVSRPRPDVETLHMPDSSIFGNRSSRQCIFSVSLDSLQEYIGKVEPEMRTVYLSHFKPSMVQRRLRDDVLNLSLYAWAQAALQPYGYIISDIRPTESHSNSHSVMLFSSSSGIQIQYRHMMVNSRNSRSILIDARIWVFSPTLDEDARNDMIQSDPPYTFALWADEAPWNMNLPPKNVSLVTHSGEKVTLRLGLGLIAPSHYKVRVEVVAGDAKPTPEFSMRAGLKDLSKVTFTGWSASGDIKLIVLGSIRRALEMQGYSVHLEHHDPTHLDMVSYSWHLTLSNVESAFTTFIKVFYQNFGDELVVVACVTLESSSLPRDIDGSEPYQDGPHVVFWTESHADTFGSMFRMHQERRYVNLTTPSGVSLTMNLSLDLAWQCEYYLLVDIVHNRTPPSSDREPPHSIQDRMPAWLPEKYSTPILTIPGHVKQALQGQTYKVRLDRPPGDIYNLTLCAPEFSIDVKLTHFTELCTTLMHEPYHSLWLVAQGKVSSLPSPGDSDARNTTWTWRWRATNWDMEDCGWSWNLPSKEIKFTLPTGVELTLRLSFYLIWPPEYCLVVEIIPTSESSRTLGAS